MTDLVRELRKLSTFELQSATDPRASSLTKSKKNCKSSAAKLQVQKLKLLKYLIKNAYKGECEQAEKELITYL